MEHQQSSIDLLKAWTWFWSGMDPNIQRAFFPYIYCIATNNCTCFTNNFNRCCNFFLSKYKEMRVAWDDDLFCLEWKKINIQNRNRFISFYWHMHIDEGDTYCTLVSIGQKDFYFSPQCGSMFMKMSIVCGQWERWNMMQFKAVQSKWSTMVHSLVMRGGLLYVRSVNQ